MENEKEKKGITAEVKPLVEAIPTVEAHAIRQEETDIDYEKALQRIEERVQFINKIKVLALKCTTSEDWVLLGGKPYLMASGAEKIRGLLGVNFFDVKYKKILNDNIDQATGKRHYTYIFEGYVSIVKREGAGDSMYVIGACSSSDKFFYYEHGKPKPLSEVDETDIMKAAYSNFIANGITRSYGLRNLPLQALRDAGIEIQKIASVQYGKKFTEKSTTALGQGQVKSNLFEGEKQ